MKQLGLSEKGGPVALAESMVSEEAAGTYFLTDATLQECGRRNARACLFPPPPFFKKLEFYTFLRKNLLILKGSN